MRAALPYFGSVGLWADALVAGGFGFRQNEHYQRRSQRNRCVIASSHDRQQLSIPLAGGRSQRGTSAEVAISYHEDWRRRHFLSIESAYGSAPYWTAYRDELAGLYARRPALLWDWNWALVAWARDQVAPQLVLAKAADWQPDSDTHEPTLGPDDALRPYAQVFADRHGWLSNLSVLDLLLCQGPAAAGYLSRAPT